MSAHTRSGRPALEQKFQGPQHWHIEGWCAAKELTRLWDAHHLPCRFSERYPWTKDRIFASTLNGIRDRIREEVAAFGDQS